MSFYVSNEFTPEERLQRARVAVMRDERFKGMAGIMLMGRCIVVDDIPTAATNGLDVLVGREFIESIDDETLRFTVLHEYFHVLYMHLLNWKHLFDEDFRTANLACDAVINVTLDRLAGPGVDGFLRVWGHAILDYQYDNMDAGEVYRLMRKQQQEGKHNPSTAGGKGKPKDFDEHRVQEAAGAQPGGDDQPGGQMTAAQIKEVKEQIDTALRQGAIYVGKMGGTMDRSLTAATEVKVDWREVLHDFVRSYAAGGDLSSWRRPARRWLSQDMYMPSRISERAKHIVIGLDTSGSINNVQLAAALAEVASACETVRPEKVDVIYWDYVVAAHETYEDTQVADIVHVTKPQGGGGTRVGAMRDFMTSKDMRPDCAIVFTDGLVERDWGGAWDCPVMWCISTKGITAPHGTSLYVPAF